MKFLLLVAGLQWGTAVFAGDIIVFSRADSLVLDAHAPAVEVKDPAKAAFLTAFKADRGQPKAFVRPAPLSNLPDYGRVVAGAGGSLKYHRSFPGGFILDVTLEGLAPNHKYLLTLNGNPQRAGNGNLPDKVPGNGKEKYYDFYTATTDAAGRYHATFGIMLPAGPYDVRFYVKDTTDFKIVLYDDFFPFTVE